MTKKTGIRALAIETANEVANVEVAQAVRLRAVALAIIYVGDCITQATAGGKKTLTVNVQMPTSPDDSGEFLETLDRLLERVK